MFRALFYCGHCVDITQMLEALIQQREKHDNFDFWFRRTRLLLSWKSKLTRFLSQRQKSEFHNLGNALSSHTRLLGIGWKQGRNSPRIQLWSNLGENTTSILRAAAMSMTGDSSCTVRRNPRDDAANLYLI